jgi:hypothetical protein
MEKDLLSWDSHSNQDSVGVAFRPLWILIVRLIPGLSRGPPGRAARAQKSSTFPGARKSALTTSDLSPFTPACVIGAHLFEGWSRILGRDPIACQPDEAVQLAGMS